MRVNYRYILMESVPQAVHPDPREIYYTVADAITELYGDAQAAIIACVIPYCAGRYVVIRCTRGYEEEVITGVATVFCYGKRPIALHPLCISGTIRTLKEVIEKRMRCSDRYEKYVLDMDTIEETEPVQAGSGHQNALFPEEEKSIKRVNPTFLTRDDLEDYHDE